MSKMQLATAASNGSVRVVQYDTSVKGSNLGGNPGFTVWPATAPNGANLKSNGGTEFFLPQSDIVKQGYIGVAGNNVNYPTIGLLNNGKGIISFTLVGDNYYPSAAYASLDLSGTGKIYIAGMGQGPQDGFTEYKTFASDGIHPRPRWGDYGATSVVGNTIYFASEYIGQTCDLATYEATGGRCGNTRGILGNWDTRISSINP